MRLVLCLLVVLVPALARAQPPATSGTSAPHAQAEADARAGEAEVRTLLDGGRIDEAATAAAAWLRRDPESSSAHAFMAIARLSSAARHIISDLNGKGARARYADDKYWRELLGVLDGELARADSDLAAASTDARFHLELCPGCWRIDWDGDGAADEAVLAVERDADDKPLKAGDPRRHPTFNFDVGDVHWARAAVAYVRALTNIGLAYRFPDLIARVTQFQFDELPLKLADPPRITKARQLILDGIDEAEHARAAYLLERDDDREWIPNPRQRSHPVPLPVDAELYARWHEALRAGAALVRGDSALDVTAMARMQKPPPKVLPHGFLDVGALFSRPRDFVFRPREIQDRKHPDVALAHVFGDAFVPRARPNPLPSLMERAMEELRRQRRVPQDLMQRQMRYVLWLL